MATATEGYYSSLCEDADMQELVEMFVQEVPDRLAQLEQCLAESNWSELARFSHQLKGAGGSYGFPQLTPVAARLEQLAKQTSQQLQTPAPVEQLEFALSDLVTVAALLRPGLPPQLT